MINKLAYQYKTSPRYFLYLLIPIFIIFVIVFFTKSYKGKMVGKVFYVNYDNLKVSIQPMKVPDVKFINEDLISIILDSISLKLLYIQPNQKNKITTLEKVHEKEPPIYKVKFIYIGVGKKYVLIGNKLLTEGDITSENEKIIKIEKDKILLEGIWGRRWIYLINIQK